MAVGYNYFMSVHDITQDTKVIRCYSEEKSNRDKKERKFDLSFVLYSQTGCKVYSYRH